MSFLNQFFTAAIPLIIIMDPLGNLSFFLLFTKQNTMAEMRRFAAIASATAFFILLLFYLCGSGLLRFFHISLPAFQLAGGFIFFVYAMQMLRLIPSNIKTSLEEEEEGISKENIALVPLATPLLAGPGAITLVLAWRQSPGGNLAVAHLVALLASCLLCYLMLLCASRVQKLLRVGGIRVATRLMGLLLAVIAVQFMVSGVVALR